MDTIKYEVFVSSSYEDLKQERAFLRDFIISSSNIPVGMEEFEASGRPSWSKIQQAITYCDYYILIVGGRYGSLTGEEEVSYTEKEYLLARELNKEIIVFIMNPKSVRSLPPDKLDRGGNVKKKVEKLKKFCEALREFFVVEFTDYADFKDKALTRIPLWMKQFPPENGGWVRASELNREICYKNVLSYLFDRINPYEDLSLTREYLQNLRGNLNTIGEVADAMEAMIKLYVNRVIAAQIRVYFAYSLTSMNAVGQNEEPEPAYRLGISNSRKGPWNQGCIYRGPSNIHNVYKRRDVLGISDTSRLSRDIKDMNQPVSGEGSVVAAPVIYGSKKYSIGVVGLNSPHPTDALLYKPLIRELGILFSSLFFAHGQKAFNSRDSRQEEAFANKLRSQLLEHFGCDE